MSLAHPPIPDHLRPHIWAVSRYHYPAYPNLPVNMIAEFLFNALNIAGTVPFVWDFIECPVPGTLFFVWMSPQTFTSPPTDGYQYLDPENVLHLPVGDKVVEVYEHKYGFNPRTEGMTSYVRRRFHLIQGGNPQLWLIHYLRAPDEDRLPASQAAPQPYPPRPFPLPPITKVEFVMSPNGQLVSFKNPNTTWQPNMPTGGAPAGYPPPAAYGGRQSGPPQQYRPAQAIPAPPAKRVKVEEEEEEEVMIPRDVAASRFIRWTEWMEEILSSGYNIRDIVPPPGPLDGVRPEVLIARTQTLEAEIKASKQHHEETLEKFKTTAKAWKDGIKKLSMNVSPANSPMQEHMPGGAPRVDGVAAAAKDAETAVSLAMTQSTSSLAQVEEINRQVLLDTGIPHIRIRKVEKCRPVGKHIEFEPAKKHVIARPGSSNQSPMTQVSVPAVESPAASVGEEIQRRAREEGDEEEEEQVQNGHATEAFEAMEAMEFDADAEFGFDSENHAGNDMAMDMGVD